MSAQVGHATIQHRRQIVGPVNLRVAGTLTTRRRRICQRR